MAKQSEIAFIQAVVQEHTDTWEKKQPELKKYKQTYETRFWEGEAYNDNMIRIETADAYGFIEGFISSLFSKQPGIEVGDDISSVGNPKAIKDICNRFLFDSWQTIESAARMALIYTNAGLKLSPNENSSNIYDKAKIRPIPPWEMIIDNDATHWLDQRYVGHRYFLTVSEASARFGNKQWTPVVKEDYFTSKNKSYRHSDNTNLPPEYLYIELVELYDMINDKLFFWTPHWKAGQDILEITEIPIRTYDGQPLPAISPLFFNRQPERPLEGISSISRIYDQLYEKNILRSFWANAIRRDSRQFLYKEGAFDEEALAQITAGIDGAMIPVDAEHLTGLITEVPVTPISSNHDRYLMNVEADLSRGSVLAPFTRGEATKATATEIGALAQYTSSEIGRLARERDGAIAILSLIYIRFLSLITDEIQEPLIINGETVVLDSNALKGKYKYVALDQAATPMSEAMKQKQFLELLPTLGQLGVNPQIIKEELVRMFNLSELLLQEPEPVTPEPVQPPSPEEALPPEGGSLGTAQTDVPPEIMAMVSQLRGEV